MRDVTQMKDTPRAKFQPPVAAVYRPTSRGVESYCNVGLKRSRFRPASGDSIIVLEWVTGSGGTWLARVLHSAGGMLYVPSSCVSSR